MSALVLRWIGAACLIIGVVLAAEGIAQVRREWTELPGSWVGFRQFAQAALGRMAPILRSARRSEGS